MTVKILLRAQDPISCAAFLGALGAPVKEAAAEPGVWRGKVTLDVELSAGPAGLDARVGAPNALAMAQSLVAAGGRADFSGAAAADAVVRVIGPNGETVTLEEVPVDAHDERPIMDVAMFAHISWWLDGSMDGLRAALARARAFNPRVVGPVALGGRPGQDFTLLVDGGPDTDLAAVDAFIADVRDGPIGLRAKIANTLPADLRARLDGIAFRR